MIRRRLIIKHQHQVELFIRRNNTAFLSAIWVRDWDWQVDVGGVGVVDINK